MEKSQAFNPNNITMKDIMHPEDLEKIKDILSYLKCNKCNDLMIEPKMCVSCSLQLCNKCHKSNCNHELIVSRHLKSILENKKFKCKYRENGCNEPATFDYFSLKRHAEVCGAFKKMFSEKSSLISKMDNSEANLNSHNFKTYNLKSRTNNDLTDFSSLSTLTCSCGEIINGPNLKVNYIAHKKLCTQKEMEASQSDSKLIRENMIKNFMEKVEKVQKSFSEVIKQRNTDCLESIEESLTEFLSSVEEKRESIKKIEEEVADYYKQVSVSKDYFPPALLEKNPEYKRLVEEEQDLKRKQRELELELLRSTEEFENKKLRGEEELKRISVDYMNKLLSYEAEEKWLKEEIANHNPELINSIFSDTDTCSFCKNSNANIKKHYCQQCCKRFCIGTCAKLCNTATCSKMSKYICPECVPSCGLCRKNIFCGSCKKSCYYVDCKYTFCPDCYKKNGHQTRAPTSNCAFFTCEVDKTKACLMTSLFCSKCEKRLCNYCLYNDKDHFPTLFK